MKKLSVTADNRKIEYFPRKNTDIFSDDDYPKEKKIMYDQ
jgi:hypothetical protein